MPSVGSKIRMRRAEIGMTQTDLAAKAALSLTTINDLEKGRIKKGKPENIHRIASVLGVSYEYLASEDAGASATADPGRPGQHSELSIVPDEELTRGIKDLLADELTMKLTRIDEEEIEWLKSIRFRHDKHPTKETYLHLLYEYRKLEEDK